jgi:RNA polymerase sigma-70 factor (TIGR02960 family)
VALTQTITDERSTDNSINDVLAAARDGDEHAFGQLTEPLRKEIHVHCYRMLGSLDDADDAIQETLIRAWRRLDTFEPRAPFRAWVYRIATNVCLTMLSRRDRTETSLSAVMSPDRMSTSDLEGELMRLDPYPDHLLDDWSLPTPGPEATYERQESVELAFVSTVQLLPPRQRAALLLRDVIGYTAAEVATMLETSVAGVNSALQRARATIDDERTRDVIARPHTGCGTETERNLVRRLADAWHAVDVPAIVALLTEDALLTMPPEPTRVEGREAIAEFLRTVPAGGQLNRFRLVPTRANGQPAMAFYYRPDEIAPFQAYGLFVLSIQGETIASLTAFRTPALVTKAGLPATVS